MCSWGLRPKDTTTRAYAISPCHDIIPFPQSKGCAIGPSAGWSGRRPPMDMLSAGMSRLTAVPPLSSQGLVGPVADERAQPQPRGQAPEGLNPAEALSKWVCSDRRLRPGLELGGLGPGLDPGLQRSLLAAEVAFD